MKIANISKAEASKLKFSDEECQKYLRFVRSGF